MKFLMLVLKVRQNPNKNLLEGEKIGNRSDKGNRKIDM